MTFPGTKIEKIKIKVPRNGIYTKNHFVCDNIVMFIKGN